ncbi:MAG: TRAP transporter small permease [Alphaproteobacteria bacterium]|nr:TRAP transporter small permease [Alphaproteobacteria bacterium]MDA7983645.1 TRAP transporter small permease [Alphaproteobacteria bacterium]MDA7984906.1 TRAP transporter small permease [Alphaproteobacteria bacterium]MDA7987775.1 TRAP transporter small permease [Alphaproteobacteria bacterium]MDA7989241.1 TRAP transporter small permease [Alphaproteobacteria bacterium]
MRAARVIGRGARAFSRALARAEEACVSLLLAAMVIVSFSQVVARYVFNSGWVPALELTTVLFAWMILLGMSYGVRVGAHLGVDALIRLLPRRLFRAVSIFAALVCVFWALLLFETLWFTAIFGMEERGGALAYVRRMHSIGLELEDLPVERWIAYTILPVGLLLFAYRSIEAIVQMIFGNRTAIISSHETPAIVDDKRAGASSD